MRNVRKLTIKDAYSLVHRGMLALARAERQGIRIDMEAVSVTRAQIEKDINDLTEQFCQTNFYKDWSKSKGGVKVNINSGDQLGEYLYQYKKYPKKKLTKTGKGSTEVEALESLNNKDLDLLIQIRKLQKINNTYIESFIREEVNGYIHPFFNLDTVKTFRSSSQDPNFQNIPVRDTTARRLLRSLLFPRPGHMLLEVDYSGVEVGISCCYHKDKTMINYVKNPQTNMHTDMAHQIYFLEPDEIKGEYFKTLRQSAKNGFVFPQFYGDYYKGNAESIIKWLKLGDRTWHPGQGVNIDEKTTIADHLRDYGIKSFDSFAQHLKSVENHFWNTRFWQYRDWKEKVWAQYQKDGYLETLTGFVIKGPMRKNALLNAPIQGSAFHCLLWSFIEIDRIMQLEKWDTKLIGQIHDSIILDVNPAELDHVLEVVKRVTCVDLINHWDWIIVPLAVEAELSEKDCSWKDKKEIKI